jgi:hypothetical protein
VNHGRVEPTRFRATLSSLPMPRAGGGRIVLAVDVSPWLRPEASTSAHRLFCHVYGRAKNNAQLIPGWPYSFVAALESGATSWTAVLDAVRLGPTDDATAVTTTQLREVVTRLIDAGHWQSDDPNILIVTDSGYDITRLAFVLQDLPVDAKAELIEPAGTSRQGKRPERTVYGITRAGRELARDRLRELLSTVAPEYSTYCAALAFMPLLPMADAVERVDGRLLRRRRLRGLRGQQVRSGGSRRGAVGGAGTVRHRRHDRRRRPSPHR